MCCINSRGDQSMHILICEKEKEEGGVSWNRVVLLCCGTSIWGSPLPCPFTPSSTWCGQQLLAILPMCVSDVITGRVLCHIHTLYPPLSSCLKRELKGWPAGSCLKTQILKSEITNLISLTYFFTLLLTVIWFLDATLLYQYFYK